MPQYQASKIGKSLLRKGFKSKEGDHKFYTFYYNDKKTSVFTKISHSSSTINDSLLGLMARQLKLNKNDFCNLVDCPLSEKEYADILIKKKEIIV